MSVSCNEVKWCVDTTPLRSLLKLTPVVILLFGRLSWLRVWYQFYFRRLSRWSIVGQPACPLTHSSGVSFNWQSTLCSGLITRLLEIRHSIHFLFLFSRAIFCCFQGPLLVRGNRGSAGHEQLFQRCEAKLRHPHLCQGASSTILPEKLILAGSLAQREGGILGNGNFASWNLRRSLAWRCSLTHPCSTIRGTAEWGLKKGVKWMGSGFCLRSPTSSSHKESLSSRATSQRLRFADRWLQIKLCSGGDWNIGGCSKEPLQPLLDQLDQPEEAREVDQHQPAGRHKPSAASTKHWIQRDNSSTTGPSSTRPHPICSSPVRVRRVPDCEPAGGKLTREYDSWNSAQNLEQEEESAPFIETCSTPEEAFSVQVAVDDQTFVASCTKPHLAWREGFKNKYHVGRRGESCDNPEAAQHPTQRTEGEKWKHKNQKMILNPVCNTSKHMDPSVQNFPIFCFYWLFIHEPIDTQ